MNNYSNKKINSMSASLGELFLSDKNENGFLSDYTIAKSQELDKEILEVQRKMLQEFKMNKLRK